MKNILTILVLSITLIGYNQSKDTTNSKNSKIKLVGIWILTDFNQPDKFEDIWEFTSNNIFNELKFKADGDRTLVPDGNGTWILKENKLTITVIGESFNGKKNLYKKPQVMHFELSKEGDDIILIVVRTGKTDVLRLTKKK
jgi:hypothetical protein